MRTSRRNTNHSRRQVQRRFPPGAFVINSLGNRMAVVIGWAPVEAVINSKTGREVSPITWEALILHDQRLERIPWQKIRDDYNIDEWKSL